MLYRGLLKLITLNMPAAVQLAYFMDEDLVLAICININHVSRDKDSINKIIDH